MRVNHKRGRATLGLVTVLAVVVSLVGATGAGAAPRVNFQNVSLCLQGGGWRSLQTSNGAQFRGPLACVFYVLGGGTPVPKGSGPGVE